MQNFLYSRVEDLVYEISTAGVYEASTLDRYKARTFNVRKARCLDGSSLVHHRSSEQ